jgi:hypothetical protein
MAAAELTGRAGERRSGAGGAIGRVYLALWALTLGVGALTDALAAAPARGVIGLALRASGNPAPSPGRVFELAVHNLPICAWPLLLGSLALERGSRWRHVADVVVAACALANVLPVAAALGGYGWALFPYMPQLPLEWAALAVGYGSWTLEREYPLGRTERLRLLGVLSVLLLVAAALETCGVPHR